MSLKYKVGDVIGYWDRGRIITGKIMEITRSDIHFGLKYKIGIKQKRSIDYEYRSSEVIDRDSRVFLTTEAHKILFDL